MTRIRLDITPQTMLASTEHRTIHGVAIPRGQTFEQPEGTFAFADEAEITPAYEWATPLLAYHDSSKPLGLLSGSAWSDDGYAVQFKVSKTLAGDEALQLAADGVLGLSVGVDIDKFDYDKATGITSITAAKLYEISLTPTPALSGARITDVHLSGGFYTPTEIRAKYTAADELARRAALLSAQPKESTMPDIDPGSTPEVELHTGPTVQPVPRVTVTADAHPYPHLVGGGRGLFTLTHDLREQGWNPEARERLIRLAERSSDELYQDPKSNRRPDLAPAEYEEDTPLTRLVKVESISDNSPIYVERFSFGDIAVKHYPNGPAEKDQTDPDPSGSISTADQLVQPEAIASLLKFTRQAWDRRNSGDFSADARLWAEIVKATAQEGEAAVAGVLADLDDIEEEDIAAGDASVKSLMSLRRKYKFMNTAARRRYNVFAVGEGIWTALSEAVDDSGRPLLNVAGQAVNSYGSQSEDTIQVGATTIAPCTNLPDDTGYLLDSSRVILFRSGIQRFDLVTEMSHVRVGAWSYLGTAITDVGAVVRVTIGGE